MTRRSHERSMEALYIVILCIFGSTLNLLFTSACDVDDDCLYTEQQCCVRGTKTPSGNVLEKGVCIAHYNRGRCHETCRKQDDCVLPQRCDTTRKNEDFLCTTKCSKDEHCYHINQEYVCDYNEAIGQNECRMPAKEGSSSSRNDIFFYFLIGSVGAFLCICCTCLKFCEHRSQRAAGGMVARNARPTGTNAQPNANAERPETLQMNSTQVPPEESSGPKLDAVALSGPPSYIEVDNVPESPPPTYEEATRT